MAVENISFVHLPGQSNIPLQGIQKHRMAGRPVLPGFNSPYHQIRAALIPVAEAPYMDVVGSVIQFDQFPGQMVDMNPGPTVNMGWKFLGQYGNFH
jgi:hypothetical protein